MLGKLIKYEFKATGRTFLPMFGALLAVSIVSRLFLSLRLGTPSVIGIMLSVILIISVFVITLIITLQRFYKNLLTNEGYLMFTLPVTADSIIWSKLIVASVWNILSIIIVMLAIAIMAITEINPGDIFTAVSIFMLRAGIDAATLSVFVAEAVILALSSLLSGILMFYACMSLSLLVNKHRVLISFAAYLVITTIGQVLSAVGVGVIALTQLPQIFLSWELAKQVHTVMLLGVVLNAACGVIFYFLSRYMLKNKLNLE